MSFAFICVASKWFWHVIERFSMIKHWLHVQAWSRQATLWADVCLMYEGVYDWCVWLMSSLWPLVIYDDQVSPSCNCVSWCIDSSTNVDFLLILHFCLSFFKTPNRLYCLTKKHLNLQDLKLISFAATTFWFPLICYTDRKIVICHNATSGSLSLTIDDHICAVSHISLSQVSSVNISICCIYIFCKSNDKICTYADDTIFSCLLLVVCTVQSTYIHVAYI